MTAEQAMSEHGTVDSGGQARDSTTASNAGTAATDSPPPRGYGARLEWERQRVQLSVSDVASTLRLHPKQVRAMEEEDLQRLPEAAYVRGFIRSYARLLGIDAAPLLADLNSKLGPEGASVIDAMTATHDYSPVRAAAHERMSRQIVIGVAVIGLIALGIIGWQSAQPDQSAAPPQVVAAASPLVQPVESSAAGAPEAKAVDPSSAASPLAPADDAPVPAADSAASASALVPTLSLRFSGPSWVEVTDATGKILLSELSSAGAERELDGAAPLTVVIGDATVTTVSVRGEPFNLQPYSRNNVARFTVKAE